MAAVWRPGCCSVIVGHEGAGVAYQAGKLKLKLDELITRRYRIDEAPQAFEDLAQGRHARGVIVFE